MRVKTFKGPEKDHLLKTIHEEYGDDAEILSTRERRTNGRTEVVIEVSLGGGSKTTLAKDEKYPATCNTIRIRDLLLSQGLSPRIIDGVLRSAQFASAAEPIDAILRNILADLLSFDSHLNSKTRFNLLIGPEKSGKTSAAGGIAARIKENQEFKVGLLSADGAAQSSEIHLQTFAKLFDCPYRMFTSGSDFKTTFMAMQDYFNDCDLVLVDSPGITGDGKIPEIVRLLAAQDDVATTVLIPGTADRKYLSMIPELLKELEVSRVALTMTDRTFRLGPVLNSIVSLGKPLAFLADGEGGIDHCHPLSPQMLVEALLREFH